MFDRCPDAQLVADLVAVQSAAPASSAAVAARGLIEELVAWQRVASWVESQRLDVMRRFEVARITADRDLVVSTNVDAGTANDNASSAGGNALDSCTGIACVGNTATDAGNGGFHCVCSDSGSRA